MDKMEIRKRRGRQVVATPTGFEGVTDGQLRTWQSEWQKEHCRDCTHFDTKTNDFHEKNHPNHPGEDCTHHWTDIVGQCWNYRTAAGGRMVLEVKECLK